VKLLEIKVVCISRNATLSVCYLKVETVVKKKPVILSELIKMGLEIDLCFVFVNISYYDISIKTNKIQEITIDKIKIKTIKNCSAPHVYG